jgi:hypothetical protein
MIYPSVTQVISPWVDFSMIPAGTLQAAADRGTAIHDHCAKIAMGVFVIVPPEHQGYVTSFQRWFDAMVQEVILAEERLTDITFGYHGQIDILAKMKTGEIDLVDLKSPLAKSKSWAAQLSGYKRLVDFSEYPSPDRVGSLRLSPDGKTPRMDWYENGIQDFNAFLSCLNCYRYFHS